MDFQIALLGLDSLGNINFEAIAQLTMLALIVIAGPAVIFVLAFRGGDL
jgi:Photosystem II complex subunit Ycf12